MKNLLCLIFIFALAPRLFGAAAIPAIFDANSIVTRATGTADGTKFLRDDGVLAVPSGGGGSGTPGGSSGAVQFNQSGAFDGTNDFTYDRTNGNLTVPGQVASTFGLFHTPNTSAILSADDTLFVFSDVFKSIYSTDPTVSLGGNDLPFASVASHFAYSSTNQVTNCLAVGNESSGGRLEILSGVTNASGNVTNVGAVFSNSNPALVGLQMPAPTWRQVGNGWKTAATPGSQPIGVEYRLTPVQGTTTPTAKMGLHFGTNGAFGNNAAFSVTSGGVVTSASALTAGGTITGGNEGYTTEPGSGMYRLQSRVKMQASAAGRFEIIPDGSFALKVGINSEVPTAALHVNAATNEIGFKVSSPAFTNLVNVASNGFHATVYAPMTAALGPHWVTNGMSAIWNSNGIATYIRSSTVGSATNLDTVLKVH